MNAFVFDPEVFAETPEAAGCGCAKCRGAAGGQTEQEWSEGESADDEWSAQAEDAALEWGDAEADDPVLEWETDRRPRAATCRTPMPAEVESCRRQAAESPQYCRPGTTVKCPEIPELWTSRSVAGIPFYYGIETAKVAGSQAVSVAKVEQKRRAVGMNPAAWQSLFTWAQMMTSFGMPLSAIITAGGRNCRCVKRPAGKCQSSGSGCEGGTLSNHAYGDAFDLVGVVWKDPAAVGSSRKATIMHSWADGGDQGQLLRRINAVLRLAFVDVYDYSRKDHRDHFHCDTNRGRPRPDAWRTDDPCERNFIMGALKWLGYLDAVKPVQWDRARVALAAVARRNGMPVPTGTATADWAEVTKRLFACVALGGPAHCRSSG